MNQNLKPVIAVAGLSLAFSVAFTGLVGCNNGGSGDDETTTGMPSIYDTTTGDPTGTSDPADGTSDSSDVTTEAPEEYTEVDETVYVTVAQVNLRSAPQTIESTYVTTATKGQSFRRVKYSESWSVILLDGEEVYVSSDCVSTNDPTSIEVTLGFNAVDKSVFVTSSRLNLRDLPTVDGSSIIAVATEGQELVAIGLSTDGNWYKINYTTSEGNEVVLYASASYLTDHIVGSDFTAVNKTVRVITDTLRIRKKPSTDESSETVGYVSKNDLVTVIGVSPDNSWYKVKFTPPGGTEGEYYMTAGSTFVEDVEDVEEGSSTTTEADAASTTESTPDENTTA